MCRAMGLEDSKIVICVEQIPKLKCDTMGPTINAGIEGQGGWLTPICLPDILCLRY